jgi:intein/homing endonuclease
MSKNAIEKTLPVLVETVRMILEKHTNEKGIIHCLEENTFVRISDGSERTISELRSGDEIMTWNETEMKFEPKIVDDVWCSGVKDCIQIEFENGKSITCTPDHRILTSNRGWIQAKDLDDSDYVLSYNV